MVLLSGGGGCSPVDVGKAVSDQAKSPVVFSYGGRCLLPKFQQLVYLDSRVLLHLCFPQRRAVDGALRPHVLAVQVKAVQAARAS